MLTIKTEVKESTIAGKGIFALQFVPKGTVVSIHGFNAGVLTQSQYQEEQKNNNELVIRSGVRWVGNYFLYDRVDTIESYINHSDDPSLLYHCGISFAKRDLNIGDELTIDYTLFLAEDDVEGFTDVNSGKHLHGLSPKESLLKSSFQLVDLLLSIDGSVLKE